MSEPVNDETLRRLVALLREHLDFIDHMGLNDEFDRWLDHRYGSVAAMCLSDDETQDHTTRTGR